VLLKILAARLTVSTLHGEVRGVAVGWGTALQAARSWFRSPLGSLEFFIDIIRPAAVCMALGSTQPLTEMSTRSISFGEKRTMLRADNLATFKCRFSINSLSLDLQQPSGRDQACIGIAVYCSRGSVSVAVSLADCCSYSNCLPISVPSVIQVLQQTSFWMSY
jgi:hypothetical protein